MKQVFNVTGITCMSCVATLKEHFNTRYPVKNLSIDKDSGEVRWEVQSAIDLKEVSAALPPKYGIDPVKSRTSETIAEVSKWRQLTPLYLIGAYLFGFAGYRWYVQDLETAMLDFMGVFFLVFSFFKFLDLKGFAPSFAMYDPLASYVPLYAKVYPFIELGLGILFIVRVELQMLLYITLIVLGSTTFGVVRSLLDKKRIQCACLGTALKLPMTEATFIENAVMLTMTLFMLLA